MSNPKVYKRINPSLLRNSESKPALELSKDEKQKVESILSNFFTFFQSKHS